MKTIEITVNNKIAVAPDNAFIVCENSDYLVKFIFDEEWNGYAAKTARFEVNGKFVDVNLDGDTCEGISLPNTREVFIGVYTDNGDLASSTPARVVCKKSILGTGTKDMGEEFITITKGDKGDSAYETAVINGYEGTEAEWLESLNGQDAEIRIDNNTLIFDGNNVLKVNTATDVEKDNTLPITSGAVETVVGNIDILLQTI